VGIVGAVYLHGGRDGIEGAAQAGTVERGRVRKGHQSLAVLVRSVVQEDPLCGHVFLFYNRRRNGLRALWWDRTGCVVLYKRLAQGTFPVPVVAAGCDSAAAGRSDPGSDRSAAGCAGGAGLCAAFRAAARRRNRWLEQMVPRVVIEHDVPPEKAGWERIGTEEQVRLRYRAAHFYKELHRVPVMRSPDLNEEGGTDIVACDEGVPPTLSPRSLAAADVVAWLLVQKYERHLPLHRLHRSVLADEGIDLPASTLADWAALGGEACLRVRPPT
jgi:transposase